MGKKRSASDTGPEPLQIRMSVRASVCSGLQPLFQQGVKMEIRVGTSIKEFLCGDLGLTPEYVDSMIQTIFLDGRAVDEPGSALIGDGSILALSAAMPGLLGATLRRGSPFAPMRSQISYRGSHEGASSGDGRMTVKLFNLLLGALGPVLLRKGVWVRSKDLQDLFHGLPEKFWSASEATLNGNKVDAKSLGAMEWGEGKDVHLQVLTIDEK